jgi:hypothetical protein
MSGNVFTVGNEESYDAGIKQLGLTFQKTGRRDNYPGGFACQTLDDANRMINACNKRGEWAVYELAADWDRDTVPSKNGWWHALIHDSVIVRKVTA